MALMGTALFLIFVYTFLLKHIICKVYFEERFSGTDEHRAIINDRWKVPRTPIFDKDGNEPSLGNFEFDQEGGLKTTQDERFYLISSTFKPFTNKDKDLVIQFTVRHPQLIDCGGGYINLYKSGIDQEGLNKVEPLLTFGPDQCGGRQQILVTWKYKGTKHAIKKDLSTPYDTITHLYTLHVKPDSTYTLLVDLQPVSKGRLEKDWNFLPPRMIKDPQAKRPDDWVTAVGIDDPEDKKPLNWTEGEWKPRKIVNPAYQGPWVHPMIDNPEYHPDKDLYVLADIGAVGIDIWQVQSGSIFDNILICDDFSYAESMAKEVWEESYSKQLAVWQEKQMLAMEKLKIMGQKVKEETKAEHLAYRAKHKQEKQDHSSDKENKDTDTTTSSEDDNSDKKTHNSSHDESFFAKAEL